MNIITEDILIIKKTNENIIKNLNFNLSVIPTKLIPMIKENIYFLSDIMIQQQLYFDLNQDVKEFIDYQKKINHYIFLTIEFLKEIKIFKDSYSIYNIPTLYRLPSSELLQLNLLTINVENTLNKII